MFILNSYHIESALYSSEYYLQFVRICILTLSRFRFCSVSIYNYNHPKFDWKSSKYFLEICNVEKKLMQFLINKEC